MDKILEEVYDGVNEVRNACDGSAGGCAPDDTKQQFEEAQKYLAEKYADLVEIKYDDTSLQGLAGFPEVDGVIKRGYEFPLTFVNGEARLASRVSLEALDEIIGEIRNQ